MEVDRKVKMQHPFPKCQIFREQKLIIYLEFVRNQRLKLFSFVLVDAGAEVDER